ncbi:hypothetical protein [Micromonospora sp. NPDC050695]|uniref:hypothetical protein n=1 Tax=Micromonospora sp. NPDC050695 TaxID=3154938 RepID=UPI0033D7A054
MTRRRVLTRTLLAGGLLLTLLVAGCGVRPSAVITGRPAQSGASQGARLYLLWHGRLAPVVRGLKVDPPPDVALAILAAGPDEQERGHGFTSEVPAGLFPDPPAQVPPGPEGASSAVVTGGRDGLTVTVTGAALALSANAADQIICTVADAAAQSGPAQSFTPVTIVGPDGARPARPCPVT